MSVKVAASREDTGGARHVGALFFYAVLALLMTYPLVVHFAQGVLGPPGDNLEYLYKLWWFKHSLFDLRVSPFFTADVFYPSGYDLALHEMSLANVSLGMPLTILFGETVSYNALVLLSFVLSGFGLYVLVRRLTGERAAALLVGVVFAFCSYRMGHLGAGHLNLLGTQWLPFVFLCLEQVLDTRRILAGILMGIFFALSALSSWYYAPVTAIFVTVYVLARARPWRKRLFDRRLWHVLFISVIVAGVLMAPSAIHTMRVWSQKEMAFSLREVDVFSASIGDLVVANPMHSLWGRWVAPYYAKRQDVPEYMISLSWVALALALIAVWMRGDRVTFAYALLLGLSVVMALGTTLHADGQRVYFEVPAWAESAFTVAMGWLANRLAVHAMPSYYDMRVAGAIYVPLPTLALYLYLPLFDAMRVWTRFGMISAFSVAVLASIGATKITRWGRTAVRWSGRGVLLIAVVVIELLVAPFPLGWTEVQAQPVDRWLAQQDGEGAVALFPLWKAEHGAALYAQRTHSQPIVYGYGAFFPRRYRQVRPILWDFPTSQAIDVLSDWGVRYVLVGAESYGAQWPEVQRRIGEFDALRLVATFDEAPVYHSGWLSRLLPDFGRAFITDRVYVYELG